MPNDLKYPENWWSVSIAQLGNRVDQTECIVTIELYKVGTVNRG